MTKARQPLNSFSRQSWNLPTLRAQPLSAILFFHLCFFCGQISVSEWRRAPGTGPLYVQTVRVKFVSRFIKSKARSVWQDFTLSTQQSLLIKATFPHSLQRCFGVLIFVGPGFLCISPPKIMRLSCWVLVSFEVQGILEARYALPRPEDCSRDFEPIFWSQKSSKDRWI